jgi:hypothetical protein
VRSGTAQPGRESACEDQGWEADSGEITTRRPDCELVLHESMSKLLTRPQVRSVPPAPKVKKNEGSRSDPSNDGDDWSFDEDSYESGEYGSGPYAYRYNRDSYCPGTGYSYELGEDYGLCDKDCGWCGHCMDGVYV